MGLGGIESRKGNLKKSNSYYYQLMSLSKKNNLAYLVPPAMNNLALNHRRLQRNDSAFYYFKKLNTHYKKNYNVMGASQTWLNLGISFFQYQELDSAKYYLNKSLEGFNNIKQERFVSQSLSLLAEVSYQNKEYKKVIQLADSSLQISKRLNMKRNFTRNYSLLSRAYNKLGNSSKSNEYKKLESDALIKIEENAKVRRLNEKYDTEIIKRRGEAYNNNLIKKKFYKTNLFIVLVLTIILIGTVFYFFSKNRSIKKENLELQELVDSFKKVDQEKSKIISKNIVLKSKASIKSNDILYIKSDGHYIEFYMKNKVPVNELFI